MVTDEVYEHLVFDDHEHVPLSTLPGMCRAHGDVSSAGKTFSFTGWKIGWATGPAELVARGAVGEAVAVVQHGAPLQPAVAHALDHESAFYDELAAELQARRDLLCTGLRELGHGRATCRRAPTS